MFNTHFRVRSAVLGQMRPGMHTLQKKLTEHFSRRVWLTCSFQHERKGAPSSPLHGLQLCMKV